MSLFQSLGSSSLGAITAAATALNKSSENEKTAPRQETVIQNVPNDNSAVLLPVYFRLTNACSVITTF